MASGGAYLLAALYLLSGASWRLALFRWWACGLALCWGARKSVSSSFSASAARSGVLDGGS